MIITDYKQLDTFRKKAGIYLFTLKEDNTKNYAGKSFTLYKRIACDHKNARGKHYIDYYIKQHGLLESFIIELIHWWDIRPDKWEILALETAVIDAYDCLVQKGGYNICLFGNDSTGIKRSKETREKLKNANTGKIYNEESKIKRKQTWKEKIENGWISPITGIKQSEEACLKKSLLMQGENNHFFGKHHTKETIKILSNKTYTEEQIQNLREKRKLQDMSFCKKRVKQLDLNGNLIKIWDSQTDAAKGLGNKKIQSRITSVCQGKRKKLSWLQMGVRLMNVFTGNTFRLVPTNSQFSFIFQNIYTQNTGYSFIGLSGNSGNFGFTLNNGTLLSPQNKDILKYNVGQQISISGIFNNGLYSYYLGNSLIENNSQTSNNLFSKFIVNTTGTNLVCDNIQLSTNPITLNIIPNPTFLSASGLNGIIQNTSSSNLRIYNSNLYFSYSDESLLTGFITGNLSGNSSLSFFLWDSDPQPQYYDLPVSFLINLDTNAGIIQGYYTTIKSSGLYNTVNILTTANQNVDIPVLFWGSGLANQFIYNPPNNASALFNYSTFSRDFSGNRLSQVITFSLNPILPLNSGSYTSQYVTGIQITNSGQYLFCPEVVFTGYYHVTGLNYNLYSILLSSGCTGNIPISFNSIDGYGTNASGYLALQPVLFSGVYNTGLVYYNIVNSFNLYSGGTGYTQSPLAKLNTGIYSHCFDVPLASGFNYSIFSPFNSVGGIQPLAAYFTGETICVTGIVGSNQTGYLVSGVLIDNPGSGFNNTFYPKFSFVRTGTDNLTNNASGIAIIKQSGLYLFNNNWSILTGTTFGLSPFSGTGLFPSGYFILSPYQEDFAIQILYTGDDSTIPEVVQLSVANTTGYTLVSLISGTKFYSSDPYFLKKKILGNLTTFQIGNTFSFLTSSSDLDSIYSSSVYSINSSINIGSLDF